MVVNIITLGLIAKQVYGDKEIIVGIGIVLFVDYHHTHTFYHARGEHGVGLEKQTRGEFLGHP